MSQTTGKSEAERRKERLARALRENLKRRKEQVRGRKAGGGQQTPDRAGDTGRRGG